MCGIAGIIDSTAGNIPGLSRKLSVMKDLLRHRGPDGDGIWASSTENVGFTHLRLAIIDLSTDAAQPMAAPNGSVITYNGEIYNYRELRDELSDRWRFRTRSDTEVILAAYDRWGVDCLDHLRGMFAFAIWDERRKKLFCARDRFGIKPFYWAEVGGRLFSSSEIKALLPFLPEIATEPLALAEYLTFQYTLGEKTLFRHVHQLLPGHCLLLENGRRVIKRYWDVHYDVDFDHSPSYFRNHIRSLFDDSLKFHLRSDVPIGSYLSGGLDSSLVAILAAQHDQRNRLAFHGKFTDYPGYDESGFAQAAATRANCDLLERDISAEDLRNNIENVIYHLDVPVAGPGSFPQYMVSELASRNVKVVLGGQGGDEIFGGYARYVLAYLEQCIRAALDGTYQSGHYVVTIESIIPNLGLLREYKPMIQTFWKEGLFGNLDSRYFRLVDRSADMKDEVDWGALDRTAVFEEFRAIFNNKANVNKEAYFDKMTHFDFKCLLPALLQVEDRMSMAHGLESRVPLLDHPLVEFAARVPADVKFEGGRMKNMLKNAYSDVLPKEIIDRRDKMGFPVPLKEWFEGPLAGFINDLFSSEVARTRPFLHSHKVLANFGSEMRFSRKTWGLLSLELWHRRFHDRSAEWMALAA
jgi:asparagine synthase (glutamine-hydrolysing)